MPPWGSRGVKGMLWPQLASHTAAHSGPSFINMCMPTRVPSGKLTLALTTNYVVTATIAVLQTSGSTAAVQACMHNPIRTHARG